MGNLLYVLLAPCLAWLLWAGSTHPLPWGYTWRSLWQRRTATLATAGAIAVVVAIFVVVLSLSQGITEAFASSARADQVLVLRPNARVELNSNLERDQVRILKSSPLLDRDGEGPLVSAECYVGLMVDAADGQGTTYVAVRGLEPAGIRMRSGVRLVAGRWFNPDLPELVIPRRMAGRFQGLALGRTLPFSGRTWRVVGLFDAAGTAFDSEIWAGVGQIMQARKRTTYTSLVARIAHPAWRARFIRDTAQDRRLRLEAKAEAEYYLEQTEAGRPVQALGQLMTAILTLGAIFAAMNTMYAAVAGRTGEIGTLRALGFRRVEILASFQWEALILASLGGLAGAGLALAFNGTRASTMNFQTFSDVTFASAITPGILGQGLAFSILVGMAGGFLPAWRASRIPVTEAMKS